jgi:hypothetical protein
MREIPIELRTGFGGQCDSALVLAATYAIQPEKPGFYQATEMDVDPRMSSVKIVLAHEQTPHAAFMYGQFLEGYNSFVAVSRRARRPLQVKHVRTPFQR